MLILLAALQIPIGLVIGALVVAHVSRHAHRSAPGVFPCKIRTLSGPGGTGTWARQTAFARWVHDVLLVHTGVPLLKYRALAVRAVDAGISPSPGVKFRGVVDSISLRVTLDDGSVMEVATPSAFTDLLRGPFLESSRNGKEGGR